MCGFEITVQDREAPTIFCESTVGSFNTSINQGTGLLSFDLPTAGDNSEQAVTVTCNPSVGGRVAIGSHNITCTATDTSGQMSDCMFSATMVDWQAPIFSSCPVTRMGQTSTNRLNDMSKPVVTDNDGKSPAVLCQPEVSSVFELGATNVTCVAADTAGNSATCSFEAVVVDDEPPILQCSEDVSVPTKLNSHSATATWAPVTASDNLGVQGVVSCLPVSGAAFKFGVNQVCMSQDYARLQCVTILC
jgi:hypothetical protein